MLNRIRCASQMPDNTKREASGRFAKGVSGNPGGRPTGYAELIEAARKETPETLRKLVWFRDHAESEMVRLAACREILDRAFGKPKQGVELTGENGEPLKAEVVIRHMFKPPTDNGAL